ncbi:hypothetical protein BGZ73_006320 [Actinomortierella ambigua]|nr:hypothetical protein BGZ73_006320 [Actinomortierella ambigua]
MDATRIHIYEQGLARCDPVEIRADRLSLTLTTRRRIWRAAQRPEDKDVGMQWSSCQLWRTVETKNTLLKDLNLKFAPGQLTAIIGSSGAGKTSLLSVLLDRTSPNLQVHGDVWYNGTKNPTLRQVNSVCGYVRQDDTHLLPNLTLREMMRYNAELSMDRKMTKHEKWEKVEAIIELMGLAECADVVIGDSDNTGCSGGQRRRVSIALQLIIEPPCLVLDEPTTGLDAMSALTIVQTLKAIARTGRTVICTIHQPRSAIWKEFDNVVLLMPGGQLGYAGPRENVLDFFSYAGFSPEACTNTPDFVIDTASVDFGSEATELESRQRMDAIANKFQAYRARQNGNSSHNSREGDKRQGLEESEFKNSSNGSDGDQELKTELATKAPHFAPWTHAIPILTRRMFFNVFRERTLFFNRMCLGLVAGLIPALMFTLLDRTPMGLLTRVGYFQQFVYLSAAAVVGVVGLFPRDVSVVGKK